jgi:SAM-dependent methyltransferase
LFIQKNLASSEKLGQFTRRDRPQLHQIQKKCLIMTKPVDFDDYSKNYDQLLQEQVGFFSKSDAYFAQYKAELAKSRVNTSVQRLLEFGCGTGRNIGFLRAAFPGALVIGSDVSQASLAHAKELQPEVDFFVEQVNVAETMEVPQLSGVDVIFVAGVFHHIPLDQRASVAKKLFQRLRPGGELIVFEHNPYNPVTRRIVSNCPYDADAVLLAPKQLRGLLADSGFKQAQQGYCLFIPPRLRPLLWLEPYLSWLPLGGQYFVHVKK